MQAIIAKKNAISTNEITSEERAAINIRLDKAFASQNWHKADSEHWANEHKRLDKLAKKSAK